MRAYGRDERTCVARRAEKGVKRGERPERNSLANPAYEPTAANSWLRASSFRQLHNLTAQTGLSIFVQTLSNIRLKQPLPSRWAQRSLLTQISVDFIKHTHREYSKSRIVRASKM